MARLSRHRLRELRREADTLAKKPRKTPRERYREGEINAEFERDMRARDKEPAP